MWWHIKKASWDCFYNLLKEQFRENIYLLFAVIFFTSTQSQDNCIVLLLTTELGTGWSLGTVLNGISALIAGSGKNVNH